MFTTQDRSLLDRPLHGLVTISPAPGRLPSPRPVWFELTDQGTVQLFSVAGAFKVRRLETEPRASFVVAAPAREPERWLSIEVVATLHSDGASDLASRLAERYWDMTKAEHRAAIEAWAIEDLRRIVLHPQRITRGPT